MQAVTMLPPKYTKSVKITAHDKPIKVVATYASPKEGQEDLLEEMTIVAGESHTFPEKSENMGTWNAVRKITHIR